MIIGKAAERIEKGDAVVLDMDTGEVRPATTADKPKPWTLEQRPPAKAIVARDTKLTLNGVEVDTERTY